MSEGTLIELFARGKQDAYFHQGAQHTWFGAHYKRRSPSSREVRIEQPVNPASFGGWVDIDLPRYGDMLMSLDVRIQLPTWLPPPIQEINRTNAKVEVESQIGGTKARYGWTNSVTNFAVKRWAFYADNMLLTEGWGEFGSWYADMETNHAHAPIIHTATGTHDGSPRNIQWSATPPELIFRMPLPGCQYLEDMGLPLCAMKAQRFYVRVWIADKTNLIESSQLIDASGEPVFDGEIPVYEECPSPWGGRRIFVDGVDSGEVTLLDYQMAPLVVYARYVILHLTHEVREAMTNEPHEILFRHQQRYDFTIPASVWIAGSHYKRRLDILGFFQGLYMRIRTEERNRQNKYRDITPPGGGQWLQDFSLNVNGTTRAEFDLPTKFQELAMNTQLGRDVELDLYYMIFGVSPDKDPAGTFYLTREHKALLDLQLADVPLGRSAADVLIMGLSWNLLRIENGQAILVFPT
jgi:hypothetical protein